MRRTNMEYNNFIKEVVAELKKFYGEGYEVEVTEQMIRCDTSYDGLVIKDKKGEESPVFHLTDLYNRIQDIDLEEGETEVSLCVEYIKEYYTGEHGIEMKKKHDAFEASTHDFEKIKDCVVFTLLNKENNEKYLNNLVHYDFEGTELVVGFEIDNAEMCKMITTKLMNEYGVTLEELKALAIVNTPRIRKAFCISLSEIMEELGWTEEKEKKLNKQGVKKEADHMYFISTEDRFKGAVAVLYPGYLESIAKQLEDDLLLVFTDVHEVFVARKKDYSENIKILANGAMDEYNFEYLSDKVYLYDRNKKIITVFE